MTKLSLQIYFFCVKCQTKNDFLKDYFFGFRILNFTIFGGLAKKQLFLGVLDICFYFFGITVKTEN